VLQEAGELCIPFTTGILIGIGETRRERVESLLAIRQLHRRYGHIQEVIVQNFRARPDIPMASASEPDDDDMAHAVAMARLILDAEVSVQAPPNLNPTGTAMLLQAGINDFGGISPVTPDYINPRHPWPHLEALARVCAQQGFTLKPRLAIYDRYIDRSGFLDTALRPPTEQAGSRLAKVADLSRLAPAPRQSPARAETLSSCWPPTIPKRPTSELASRPPIPTCGRCSIHACRATRSRGNRPYGSAMSTAASSGRCA
jgi:FO synthase